MSEYITTRNVAIWVLACFAVASIYAFQAFKASHGSEATRNSTEAVGRIGAPGTPPPSKSMSVAQYGAFAYASEENYCHTARWVISGTLLPEYGDDPHPVAVKRGTRARFVERIHTDCSSNGGNDLQDQNLIHATVLEGKYAGQDRYVLPSDWYTEGDYARYDTKQKTQRRLAAIEAKKTAAIYAGMAKKNDGCALPAQEADAAGAADWSDKYQTAYDAATKGMASNASCTNPAHHLMNEGFLLSWKGWAERHIGMKPQAWADIGEADNLLQQCIDSSADKDSGLSCSSERGANESMLSVWRAQDGQ